METVREREREREKEGDSMRGGEDKCFHMWIQSQFFEANFFTQKLNVAELAFCSAHFFSSFSFFIFL